MRDLAGRDQPLQHPSYAVRTVGERRFVAGGNSGVKDGVHGRLVDGIGDGHHDGIELRTVQQRLKATIDLHIRTQFLTDALPRRFAVRRGGNDHRLVVLPQGRHEGHPGPTSESDQADTYAGHGTSF